MQITALTTAFDAEFSRAFVAAAAQAAKPDQDAVAQLCARLTGIAADDPDEIADGLTDCPMPPGFLHARMFDAATGREISSIVSREGGPITVEQISLLVTLSEAFSTGRWVETSPMPLRDPGWSGSRLEPERRPWRVQT